MTRSTGRSLVGRATSVVGRVVGRKAAPEPAEPPATKAPAKKTPAKKAAARKAPAKKVAAKKSVTQATPTGAASATKKTQTTPAKKAARTTSTKKTATTEAPEVKAAPKARKGTPASLVVLPTESPWTKEELDEVKAHLRADVKRLVPELDEADGQLHDLMVDSGDGAGADQADLGSTTFERDQEITIANNAREMLEQSQHALERIADGTYGVCEANGEPIGKMRLMAFPRATLCMTCKQREERR